MFLQAKLDSVCSYVLGNDQIKLKFVVDDHGRVKSVCALQDEIDSKVENAIKGAASMIQARLGRFEFPRSYSYKNPDFVTDIAGSCQVHFDNNFDDGRQNMMRVKKLYECDLASQNGLKDFIDGAEQRCYFGEGENKARFDMILSFEISFLSNS